MEQSIYSMLGQNREEPKEIYRTVRDGRTVSFYRVFRGYRFSDEECAALARGERLEVHGLSRKGVSYSVVGWLVADSFDDNVTMKFNADHTIPFDPEYKFGQKKAKQVLSPQQVEAEMNAIDPTSGVMNAYITALSRSNQPEPVVKVVRKDDIPVFFPVLDLIPKDVLVEVAKVAMASVVKSEGGDDSSVKVELVDSSDA